MGAGHRTGTLEPRSAQLGAVMVTDVSEGPFEMFGLMGETPPSERRRVDA